ncbi:uncharacterized protein LOC112683019 isoform X3 [Sipha flava]|uniref:Uncharacterized protein LOC112683019 isoform X3 n=1 Tax=Sipha flava TaxID=143950 RepID=A0A8B8FFW3_9HEMI|nr:uncharacterized protein LOC112683019 isoform X3 [Sipha flava]
MNVPEVKCTLLCGASDYSQSLLFESAVYWAEVGYRVVYLQMFQMKSLPIPVDGAKPPSVHALNQRYPGGKISLNTLAQSTKPVQMYHA